jgi:hypothetical protein
MFRFFKMFLTWISSTHVNQEYKLKRHAFDLSHTVKCTSDEEFGESVFPCQNEMLQRLACVIRTVIAKEIGILSSRLSFDDDICALSYFSEYERWFGDRLLLIHLEIPEIDPESESSCLPIIMDFPDSVSKINPPVVLFGEWVRLASLELAEAISKNAELLRWDDWT